MGWLEDAATASAWPTGSESGRDTEAISPGAPTGLASQCDQSSGEEGDMMVNSVALKALCPGFKSQLCHSAAAV